MATQQVRADFEQELIAAGVRSVRTISVDDLEDIRVLRKALAFV